MLFVTSTSQAKRHGLYGIERTPPSVITPEGAATVAIVEQFPWGPTGVYEIQDINDFLQTFAPAGMDRANEGVMAVIGKAWPNLKVVRVHGASEAAAAVTLATSTPTNMLTVTLKCAGTAGNSVTATVSPATDGNSNHFNLAVSITGATGTTTDLFQNLNYSGTGADSTPDLTNTILVGSIAKLASGIPVAGTFSFTGGLNGTITSPSYVGTQGAADVGIALLEGELDVDFVISGDPGNSLRPAVNAGLQAHADYMTDRFAFINGNSGQSASAAQTDVASYRSLQTCYFDVWPYQADDVDGTLHLVPPATFAASLASNLSPSTSFSWKSSEAKRYLNKIVKLEANRGDTAYNNTLAGICTLQKEQLGGYTFESAVVTNYPINPATGTYKRQRMAFYIAKALVNSLRESTDAPNVTLNQDDQIHALTNFLDGLVGNASVDPNHLPHLVAYAVDDIGSFNNATTIANGAFTIPFSAQTSSDESYIFFSMNIGPTVSVTSAQ